MYAFCSLNCSTLTSVMWDDNRFVLATCTLYTQRYIVSNGHMSTSTLQWKKCRLSWTSLHFLKSRGKTSAEYWVFRCYTTFQNNKIIFTEKSTPVITPVFWLHQYLKTKDKIKIVNSPLCSSDGYSEYDLNQWPFSCLDRPLGVKRFSLFSD